MWVCIRPRGGQDCYLLTCESRGGLELCPIHRFDGMDQIPERRSRRRLSGGKKCRKSCARFSNGKFLFGPCGKLNQNFRK
jgi:hypothetical protein